MLAMGRRLLERRKTARYAISKNAKILYRGGACQMNCAIVEISNTGARLHPKDAGLLPNEFDLIISPTQRTKCEAIHRSAMEIGVRFLSR
jgi:methyl-accepting chemotaxis protein